MGSQISIGNSTAIFLKNLLYFFPFWFQLLQMEDKL